MILCIKFFWNHIDLSYHHKFGLRYGFIISIKKRFSTRMLLKSISIKILTGCSLQNKNRIVHSPPVYAQNCGPEWNIVKLLFFYGSYNTQHHRINWRINKLFFFYSEKWNNKLFLLWLADALDGEIFCQLCALPKQRRPINTKNNFY